MFGVMYHMVKLQCLGLYAGMQYFWSGSVDNDIVESCKNEIIQSGYVVTKLCQWTLPHLQIVYNVENESWFKILEEVYEDCYIHSDNFTREKYLSSFDEDFDIKYEIVNIVASGSIGQVYKIKDRETQKIYAMKCKHPYVNVQYYLTTFLLKLFTYWIFILRSIQSKIFPIDLDVFYNSLKSQIFLTNEAENTQKMYENYRDNEYILIPKIEKYSDDIIIMEYIEGNSFFDLDISEYKKNKIALMFFILIR